MRAFKDIKKLAVIPVSVVVQQSDFLSIRQDLTENTRPLAACSKENASTSSYNCNCQKDGCNKVIDFTDIILKDVSDWSSRGGYWQRGAE